MEPSLPRFFGVEKVEESLDETSEDDAGDRWLPTSEEGVDRLLCSCALGCGKQYVLQGCRDLGIGFQGNCPYCFVSYFPCVNILHANLVQFRSIANLIHDLTT